MSADSQSTERRRTPTVWEVYARRKYDEPLYQVGTVAADDPELGTVYARTIFNEFPWIEMVIVPRSAIVHVIED
jgi:1,2-phenylacetyl-CoA epoxidase PaaB subunit